VVGGDTSKMKRKARKVRAEAELLLGSVVGREWLE
jgi:hypothetical protein